MSSRSERYAFEPAVDSDGPEILDLLEEDSSKGVISLTYTRRPDPLASLGSDCDSDIMVGRDLDTGRIVGLGVCDHRELYVNGQPETVGYFHSLKVARDYRRSVPVTRAFEIMWDIVRRRGSRYYLATVLEGNEDGQRILESKRDRLPWYEFYSDYDVYAFKTGRSGTLPDGFRFGISREEQLNDIVDFINGYGRTRQFYPVLKAVDIVGGRYPGLDAGCFHFLENPDGKIVAAGAVWDQSAYKQYVVAGYHGVLKMLFPVSFIFPVIGLPILPKPGAFLDFFTLSFYAAISSGALSRFLEVLASTCRQWPFFVAGAARFDPTAAVFSGRRHIKYSSRVYLVNLEKDPQFMRSLQRDRPPYLECGLL